MRLKQNWFLIQFKPNSHRVAERNLNQQGFKTFLPMLETTQKNSSRFISDLKPLFPGYMFVAINFGSEPWQKIRGTFGVSKLVSFSDQPRPVPTDLLTNLMLRCDKSGKLLATCSLSPGDSVKVLTGPFVNFVATAEEVDAQKRIWILLDFMGQSTRVQLKPDQLMAEI